MSRLERAVRRYERLMRWFPDEFRDRFGEGMRFAFKQEYREAQSRGRVATSAFWTRTIVSTMVHGILERSSRVTRTPIRARGVRSDLTYAWRSLRVAPFYSTMAVGTLSLGVASTAAVFAIVEGVVLRPLPYPESEELVVVLRTDRPGSSPAVAWPDLQDWRLRNAWFDGLLGYAEASYAFEWPGGAETLSGAYVTRDFFDVMGVPLHIGRSFTPEEDRLGGPDAIVLSHGLWIERFGADPNVLGSVVPLSSGPVAVVGVAAEGFAAPDGTERFWLPLQEDELLARVGLPTGGRTLGFLNVIGRLSETVEIEVAQNGLRTMAQQIDESFAKSPEQTSNVALHGLAEWSITGVRRTLFFLLAAAGLVLLVAASNVAGLALSRAAARRRELAVRTALGAPRSGLVRQLFLEGALLAGCAGLVGVAIATLSLPVLLHLAPPGLPRADAVTMSTPTLFFAAFATIASALILGLVPGYRASRSLPVEALVGGRGTGGGPKALRPQRVLVGFQVTVSVILLTGAALLSVSFARLLSVDRGFDSQSVVIATVSPSEVRYGTPEHLGSLYGEILEAVRAIPNVVHASTTYSPPLFENDFTTSILPEGQVEEAETRFWATTVIVGSDYFDASGIALLRGRDFESSDRLGSAPVVIVNEALAAALWPGDDPLGKRITFTGGLSGSVDSFDRAFFPEDPMTVVGIAADVRRDRLDEAPAPEYYRPHSQVRWGFQYLVVRAATDPLTVAASLREAVWSVDRSIPVHDVRTVQEQVRESVASERFRMALLVGFALATCLLAMVGLYAVTTLSVTRRVREMGVKLALGARRGEIVGDILRQALRLVGLGVAIGLVVSVALTRALSTTVSTMLFEIESTDPRIYFAVALLVTIVAFVACWAPARRAAWADPIASLRQE